MMAKGNFVPCLDFVLRWEGGFADHPRDPGGATNRGITLATYRRFRPGATVADLKAITEDELRTIYRKGYWEPVRGDDLPAGHDICAFDGAVNSGPRRSARWLQKALGVKADGIIGPRTVTAAKAAVASGRGADVVRAYCRIRLGWLQGLRTWHTFGRGWARRVGALEARALRMLSVPYRAVIAEAEAARVSAKRVATGGAASGPAVAAAGTQMPEMQALMVGGAVVLVAALLLVAWRRSQKSRGMMEELAYG